MIKIAIGYWLALNALNMWGGISGWLELRKDGRQVSHYLSRVLLAEGIRAGVSLFSIERFYISLQEAPSVIIPNVVVVTGLCIAMWGWLLYCRGVINGNEWRDLLKRRKAEEEQER